MKISVLIGNGFDIALGLKTKYTDFLAWYLEKQNGLEDVEPIKS